MSHLNGSANGHTPTLTADHTFTTLPYPHPQEPEVPFPTGPGPGVFGPGGSGPAGAGTGPVPGRRIRLTPASAIRMRPVHWLWAERIPAGSITLIPGREGIGKSLLLAWLIARLTRGELPGAHFGTPRPVIYAAVEDSWAQTIAPRLYAAGADLDKVFQVEVERPGGAEQVILPRDCDGLAEEISALGVVLLAMDPAISLISSGIDTFKDQQLRTALEPLFRMCDETGCAAVGLAHFNKSGTADPLSAITGSRAWAAVARAVLAVARDPQAEDGSCVLSQAKSNLGSLEVPSLRYVVRTAEVPLGAQETASVGKLDFTGESTRSVADILAEGTGDPGERAERDEASEWLRGYLLSQGGQAQRKDVIKAARAEGIAERTLARARTRAGVNVERSGFGAGSVWQLSDGHAASTGSSFVPQSGHSGHTPEGGTNGTTAARMADAPHRASPDDEHQIPFPDSGEGA